MGTVVSVSRLYVLDVKIRVVWAADVAMIGRSVDVGGRAATNRLQRGSEERKQKDVRQTRKVSGKGNQSWQLMGFGVDFKRKATAKHNPLAVPSREQAGGHPQHAACQQ